jgi:hypothetical protein
MNPSLIVKRPVQIPAGKLRNNFLDYYKTILEKVSFDPELFSKEYRKAIDVLSQNERVALNNWMKAKQLDSHHYGHTGSKG